MALVARLIQKLIDGAPLTQEEVKQVRGHIDKKLEEARYANKLAGNYFSLLIKNCKHPNKGSAHVCPDCGFDDE